MVHPKPRIIISALRGGSGKTLFSLGLIAAWRESGYRIAAFKKGPDFIDAGWLAFAAGRPCYNLDPFLMEQPQILTSFLSHSSDAEISLIEGNRGIYDGFDLHGRYSTAELAKLLRTSVLLIVDVTMATRTMAAVVKGCQAFDPELDIAGVILNRVAGSRQENLIRDAIEKYCGTPVVGSVPRLKENYFPERHMGLVPFQEVDHAERAVSWAKATVKENLDISEIWRLAHRVTNLTPPPQDNNRQLTPTVSDRRPRIGFVRDKSFWFYYPENLEQLERLGAVLVKIDALSDRELPPLSGLYIGGGFPETQASALSNNLSFQGSLREAIERGLPVYAECGGFMYLGESLIVGGKVYPMVGALPVKFVLQEKPQGHGYTVLEVKGSNPYYQMGEILKGHEFHYSKAVLSEEEKVRFIFEVSRGQGMDGLRDGMCKNNLLATFTHVHAGGNAKWAENLFRVTLDYEKSLGKNFKTTDETTIDRKNFPPYTKNSK
jgi:cobyrinic acid a,c-diamide synthase